MYSIKSLTDGIESAKKNIEIFKIAINKEKETIEEYKSMIEVLKQKHDRQEAINIDVDQNRLNSQLEE